MKIVRCINPKNVGLYSNGLFVSVIDEDRGYKFTQFLIDNKDKIILFVRAGRLGFSSENSEKFIPMKITEERYKLTDNYKVQFEDIFGAKDSFYISDLESMLMRDSDTVQLLLKYT